MNESLKTIEYKNCLIKIYQDDGMGESPDEWGDENVFLVGYHRDFEVKRDSIITKEQAIAISTKDYTDYKNNETKWFKKECKAIEKKYYLFGLEAYIHSGVVLALSREGNFPDRQWDVSQLGLILVSKKEAKTKIKAKKMAYGLIKTWNDYLSGNIYGFMAETKDGDDIGSVWGFYGDYDTSGIIDEAKSDIDVYVKTEADKLCRKTKNYIIHKVDISKRK